MSFLDARIIDPRIAKETDLTHAFVVEHLCDGVVGPVDPTSEPAGSSASESSASSGSSASGSSTSSGSSASGSSNSSASSASGSPSGSTDGNGPVDATPSPADGSNHNSTGPSSASGDGHSHTALIIGCVVGGVLCVMLLVVSALIVRRKHQRRADEGGSATSRYISTFAKDSLGEHMMDADAVELNEMNGIAPREAESQAPCVNDTHINDTDQVEYVNMDAPEDGNQHDL